MTVNIVVFIDCYSTIYLLLRTSSDKKNKRRMRIWAPCIKFFGGKIKNFEQGFGEQKMTKNKLTRLQNKN